MNGSFADLIRLQFGIPPGARRPEPADRLERIADLLEDIRDAEDERTISLEEQAAESRRIADTLNDILAVLEDIRDEVHAIADEGSS